jgi:hypothetical protein
MDEQIAQGRIEELRSSKAHWERVMEQGNRCTATGCDRKAKFGGDHCKTHEDEDIRAANERFERPNGGVIQMHPQFNVAITLYTVEWDQSYRHARARIDGEVFRAYTMWGARRKALRWARARHAHQTHGS